MRLGSVALLFGVAAVSAQTTGPYQVGSGLRDYGIVYFPQLSQGQSTFVTNTTRQCSFKGPGVNVDNVAVQVLSTLYSPSRVNVSVINIGSKGDLVVKIPPTIVKTFTSLGATTLSANHTKAFIKVSVISGSSSADRTLTTIEPLNATSRPIGTDSTGVVLPLPTPPGGANYGIVVNSSTMFQPGQSLFWGIGAFTFNLTGAGREINVTCAQPARVPAAGWTNVVTLPSPIKATYDFAGSTTNSAGSPGPSIGAVVGGIKTNCTFGSVGKYPFVFTLAGSKSSSLVSSSSPIVFKQGQSNAVVSSQLVAFLRTKYPSISKASFKLSAMNVTITNASPSARNLVPSGGYTTPVYDLPASSSSSLTVTFPKDAPASTYPDATFTPTKIGQSATAVLSFGSASGVFNLFDSGSSPVATVPFVCDDGKTAPAALLAYDIA